MSEKNIYINEMQEFLGNQEGYAKISLHHINLDEFVFEERLIMNCFYCGKYNHNWKCPPRVPDCDYQKIFSEYDSSLLALIELPFTEQTYNDVRHNSSVKLHQGLLLLEKYLWDHNNSTAISFIGGSCKLCKNGCGETACNNPYKSRSPLEAAGVNILKTAAKCGIDITFPPKDKMLRIGALLW
jgi:predicted metal-binding protein